MTRSLTAARLRSLLDYDPETGLFRWRVKLRGGKRADIGSVAGYADAGRGYWVIYIDGRQYRAHRLAWLHVKGQWPPRGLDHEDTDKQNNSWSNLRLCTQSQNTANSKRSKRNTTGFKGACVYGNRFQAQIKKHGKRIHLGTFDTAQDAHAAYVDAAKRLFGEFARAQ